MVEEEVRPEGRSAVGATERRSVVLRRRRLEQPPLPHLGAIMERTWYLAQVPSGRETLVAELMRGHGHQAIVPVVRCWRKRSRYSARKVERDFALLARYLILGFAPSALSAFDDLRRFSFVQSIVCDGRGYAPIMRVQLIEFVKLLGSATWTVDAAQRFMVSGKEFQLNDEVEVLSGPFIGWRGIVKAFEGKRAVVEVELFDRLTTFRMPLESLAKAE